MGQGIPHDYVMKNSTKFADPMLAFSDKGGQLGECKTSTHAGCGSQLASAWSCASMLNAALLLLPHHAAAEGKVWQKFDCEVARRTAPAAAGGGGSGAAGSAKVVLDPEYRKLSRQRHQAAAVKTRTVQYLQDTKLVGAPSTVQIGQKRKEVMEKRDRMDASQLTSILFRCSARCGLGCLEAVEIVQFSWAVSCTNAVVGLLPPLLTRVLSFGAPHAARRLFEKQPRWSFPQLQKDTAQPTQHLKEVIAEIAVKNPRGPYKDLWELKKGGCHPPVADWWLWN